MQTLNTPKLTVHVVAFFKRRTFPSLFEPTSSLVKQLSLVVKVEAKLCSNFIFASIFAFTTLPGGSMV